MEGVEYFAEIAQLNTIHRCKYCSAENCCLTTPNSVVSELFERSVFAVREEE